MTATHDMTAARLFDKAPAGVRRGAVVIAALGAGWLCRGLPGPALMPAIAVIEYIAAKALSLEGAVAPSATRLLGYLFLWPGMDARAFFGRAAQSPENLHTLAAAVAQLVLGVGLVTAAVAAALRLPAFWAGWLGMLGFIFCLHFGLFALAAWLWRRGGVNALPIMRSPLLATSLAELWGARWNLAFADLARRFVFRPVARRAGAAAGSLTVFLVSGLIHESVITVPAGAGYGRPTAYFLLQGLGVLIEKSAAGKALGLGGGAAGRAWAVAVAVLPLPLAFPAAFTERVIAPVVLHLHLHLP